MYKKTLLTTLLIIVGLFLSGLDNQAVVLAQCNLQDFSGCGDDVFVPQAVICSTVGTCLSWVVNVSFLLATFATFLYLLFAGLKYITAGGDAGKVGAAQQSITNAVIGLVVVILAWTVTYFPPSVLWCRKRRASWCTRKWPWIADARGGKSWIKRPPRRRSRRRCVASIIVNKVGQQNTRKGVTRYND